MHITEELDGAIETMARIEENLPGMLHSIGEIFSNRVVIDTLDEDDYYKVREAIFTLAFCIENFGYNAFADDLKRYTATHVVIRA